ncbi:MAG: hypothetical protein ACERKN_08465 [Velocimicrobium sp.]
MKEQGITPKEIEKILEKYRIGKKPLAKLLGWGETTIIRYLSGDIPSKEYSDKLLLVKKNPSYFYQILHQNENNITQIAYQKSLRAIYSCILSSKASVIVHYMKNHWEGILPIEGYQCLLYFAQGFYLGMYGKLLFEGEYKITDSKIPYGELNEEILYELTIPHELLNARLSQREKDLLEGIVKAFRWYGFTALKEIMIRENDGLKISRNKGNERIISYDTIEKQFQWIIKEYMVLKPEDVWKYIDSKFAETRKWKLLSTW